MGRTTVSRAIVARRRAVAMSSLRSSKEDAANDTLAGAVRPELVGRRDIRTVERAISSPNGNGMITPTATNEYETGKEGRHGVASYAARIRAQGTAPLRRMRSRRRRGHASHLRGVLRSLRSMVDRAPASRS